VHKGWAGVCSSDSNGATVDTLELSDVDVDIT
jgi:hypothetical protein